MIKILPSGIAKCFRSAKKLKLNMNSRLVVIFVLILAKLLSETAQRKLVTQCLRLDGNPGFVIRWSCTNEKAFRPNQLQIYRDASPACRPRLCRCAKVELRSSNSILKLRTKEKLSALETCGMSYKYVLSKLYFKQ